MEPKIETRQEQPYVGIRESTPPDGIAQFVDRAFPQLFGRLEERGLAPAAAPFLRYHRLGEVFDLEAGVPVAAGEAPEALPAGRWATLLYVGPYSGLQAPHEAVQRWVDEHGLAWAEFVEHYRTDPSAEPDPAKWETEIAYRLR
jgi:hypothetical protein